MIKIYEKITEEINPISKEKEIVKVVCPKKDATHVHYCRHDEVPVKSCKRITISDEVVTTSIW